MDFNNKTLSLVFMLLCVSCVQGVNLPAPDNLQVSIMERDVIVFWDKPTNAPVNVQYNVEFGRYQNNEWNVVNKCSKISMNFCYITDLIEDYKAAYKVRVQLEGGDADSWTTKKKFLLNSSELQPPSFTMWATSSTLTVHVHQNPILRKLFDYGVTYTIFLEEKGQNKRVIAYLKDDVLDPKNEKIFTSLHWGKEYCVSVNVEGTGSLARSQFDEKCIVLPEQEWIITSIVSLTISGFLILTGLVALFILCYIKRPVKTPSTLKSPSSGWRPVSVGESPVELVTNKGWFLLKKTDLNHPFANFPTTLIAYQQSEEEERRPSTDSGFSMKSTTDPAAREGSESGSVVAQDSIGCHFPIQDEESDTLSTAKTDDSGMGLSCHSDASSLNMEEQDSECLNKSGHYHSQKLFSVCVHRSDNEEKHPEPQLVSVVSGYRTNASFCTCSEANMCMWCHTQSNYIRKYKSLLQSGNIVNSPSSYCPNNPTNNMDQTETSLRFGEMEQTFPLLTSLSTFPLMEKGRDLNMNDISISLCDVELTTY